MGEAGMKPSHSLQRFAVELRNNRLMLSGFSRHLECAIGSGLDNLTPNSGNRNDDAIIFLPLLLIAFAVSLFSFVVILWF